MTMRRDNDSSHTSPRSSRRASLLGYYALIAFRSLRHNKVLTILMIVAIAFGIGASMTTLTVYYVLAGDPLPDQSSTLFTVQLDAAPMKGFRPGQEPEDHLTRYDAESLLRDRRANKQAMMAGGRVAVEPEDEQLRPFFSDARYTSSDFFSMFAAPFRYGHGWSENDDSSKSRVAVISGSLSDRLFGQNVNSVGKTIRMGGTNFQIVGVMGNWNPVPRFYDLNARRFGGVEDVLLPFSTFRELDLTLVGSINCWAIPPTGNGADANAPCTWVQYWVELSDPAAVSAYRDYLTNYSSQQRAAGRFERPNNVRLRSLMEWLSYKGVVPSDVRLQVVLAFGFLVVCLVNTIGLLLAKFLRRSSEIGVRRALGASRHAIFFQCLVEAVAIGIIGGALGLLSALVGLWGVRHQSTPYAEFVHLDATMLLVNFSLALVASVLAGVIPAWRAMQISPALQLKS